MPADRQDCVLAEAMLDTVDALVVVTDLQGRILRFNKTCESVTGFVAAEVVGRSVVDALIPAEQRDDLAEVIVDLSERGTSHFENDWITADGGRRRIVWTNTNVTDATGSVREILGTGIDVTEQRQLESRLAQLDRLDSIGRLAAGVAHDISNTMTTLCLRVERLSARELDDDSQADLASLARIIGRTQHLITDLLLFSRSSQEAAKRVELNSELGRHRGMIVDLLGNEIAITFELTSDDTTVLIAPTELEQTLTNLVVNARDAMPAGGTLTITTAVEHIESRAADGAGESGGLEPGRYVVVSVADSGLGIDSRDISHVFEPYFTTKSTGQGTGLGLATVYGMVANRGGTITVDSQPGRGTTFHVWLPRSASRPGDESSGRVANTVEP